MSLYKKPVFWMVVLLVGAGGIYATQPEPPVKKSAVAKSPRKATSKAAKTAFLKEDFEARFAPVNIELRNSFQPVVVRTTGGLGKGEALANSIPADFAGGEATWTYTGNVEIDGVPTALLENKKTGEGVFLKSGERWKSAAVAQILPDCVVMKGPSGTKTFTLPTEDSKPLANANAPMRVEVPNNLRGAIGRGRGQNQGFGGINVVPDGSGTMMLPVDGSQPQRFIGAPEQQP